MKTQFYSSKSKEEMMEIIMEFFSAECAKTNDYIEKYSMDHPIRRQQYGRGQSVFDLIRALQYGRGQSVFDLIRALDIHDRGKGE